MRRRGAAMTARQAARNDKSSYRNQPYCLIIQRLLMEVAGAPEERVRILVTNDDGLNAPGLQALRTELLKLGEVLVVAPASEQSGVGHSITLLTPLLVQEVLDDRRQFLGWAVEGRPADCVKLAL